MEFLRSAKILSFLTLMSRVLGLIRDMITTAVLSAGLCDALILAWTLPNVFRNLFGEGALSSAFIPVFNRVLKKESLEQAFLLARRVITSIGLFLIGLVVLLIGLSFLIPEAWLLTSFGDNREKLAETLRLGRILLPYLAVVCVIAQCQALLNSLKEFFLPALSPIVLNATWIVAAALAGFVIADESMDRALFIAVGIMCGALFQALLFAAALRRKQFPMKPALSFKDQHFKRVLATTGPMILGVSAVQLNVLVDRWMASAFIPGDGGVTHLYVGNRLMQFPFALIGVALSTALFPLLARLAADGDSDGMKENLRAALRISFFLSIPAAVGLWLLGDPILTLFFQRMEFTADRIEGALAALRGYALGVPFLISAMLATRLFYAMEKWMQPVLLSIALVGVNLVLDLLLVGPYAEGGVAAATSIVAFIQAAVLLLLLRRSIGRLGGSIMLRSIVKTLGMTLCLAAAVLGSAWLLGPADPDESLVMRTLRVFVPLLAGLAVFLIPARWICRFEWTHLMDALRRRRSTTQ
jgi:putative peptidoglycan lipid II flippase